jgi:catechol 2,3-dioxygenase-like lactoylglutathione lyase family enzyme
MSKLIEYVDHVQLPVNNIEKATEWYSKVLGLEILSIHSNSTAWLKFGEGPVLMLYYSSKETKISSLSEEEFPMPAFMFLTKNIKKLNEILYENKTLIRMYRTEGYGWVIKFVDPFGNELGAYQPNV